MITNPTTEQPVSECCYCEQLPGDQPTTTIGGQLIHKACLESLCQDLDQHREEDDYYVIPDDGYADGGVPYTDEELAICPRWG